MEWTDEGIVVGVRRHGEANAIVEVLTVDHGRHLGLVRGGASARQRPILQPGNGVRVTWRARLDEHLGYFAVEGMTLRAASYLTLPHALFGVTHLCALARLLPERDPHPALHALLDHLLERMEKEKESAQQVVRFELHLLAELGFGLDLGECAATGRRDDLIYVSPKSGRAICRDAGAPWRDKLLQLPAFLSHRDATPVSRGDLAAGFALTGFFLSRYVLDPRGDAFLDARAKFIAAVLRTWPETTVESVLSFGPTAR